MRRMFRYEVPISNDAFMHHLTGDPVKVGNAGDGWLEFWAESTDEGTTRPRAFKVLGTGQPIPDGARWIGTAPRTNLGLVWHLYELEA